MKLNCLTIYSIITIFFQVKYKEDLKAIIKFMFNNMIVKNIVNNHFYKAL